MLITTNAVGAGGAGMTVDWFIIAPPLTMTHAQIDELVGLIRTVLDLTLAELKAAGHWG